MELIKLYGEAAILDSTTASKIAEFEKMAKEIKAKEDELKKEILKEMESKGIIKLDTDELTISYVAPTDRETLDTKALREELPDIYDTYVKISPVKSSIRIKLKG
jgi:predicted phage-related endonuclease